MSIKIPLPAMLAAVGFVVPLLLFWLGGGEFVRGERLAFTVFFSLVFAGFGAAFPAASLAALIEAAAVVANKYQEDVNSMHPWRPYINLDHALVALVRAVNGEQPRE